MSEQPEDDGFDDIVNLNQGNTSERPSFRSITEAVQQVYPLLYDGILVRSIVILDRVDGNGDRELAWAHGSDCQPWEVLGMVQQILHDMQSENSALVAHAMKLARGLDGDFDEDDDEGEQ